MPTPLGVEVAGRRGNISVSLERLIADSCDMRVDRPDGSMVSIYLESPAGAVLTVEQVLAIAVDTRVSFYP
ncbi:hypothetical protein AB0J82_28470 [Asanoa sp. NPDC049518]|uniref:hypothetical protein n=1 Tax=unclassified Asanoa TaxID=2685164 RepID=UPI00342DDAE3